MMTVDAPILIRSIDDDSHGQVRRLSDAALLVLAQEVILRLSNLSVNASFAGGMPSLSVLGVIEDNDGSGPNRALLVSDPVIVEGDGGQRFAAVGGGDDLKPGKTQGGRKQLADVRFVVDDQQFGFRCLCTHGFQSAISFWELAERALEGQGCCAC